MAKGFADLDDVAKEHNIGGKGGGFYTVEEGDNRIRLISGYEVTAKHWANKKMLGLCIGKDKGCTICNLPEEIDPETQKPKSRKPDVKFLMYVIDRKDGKIKVAEFGWSIVNAMKTLSLNEEYGFTGLPPYDMVITKTVKNGGKNISDTSYQVLPARANTELTEDEKGEIAGLTPIEEVARRIKAKAGGEGDEDAAAEREQYGAPAIEEVDEINPEDLP
jgi:hypothetical protein